MGCFGVNSSKTSYLIKVIEKESNNNNENNQENNFINIKNLPPVNQIPNNEEILSLNNNTLSISSDNTLISLNSFSKEIEMNKEIQMNEIFDIKKEENSNLTILNVIVKANRYEAMYPIWIEKNTKIIFNVTGKWKIDNLKECSSIGIIENNNNNKNNKFNDGALIGRILNEDPFVINDNLTIISKISGPLFLKMNVKNLYNKILPSGKLNLRITGAKSIDSFDKIDEMIGWEKNIKIIEYNNNENKYYSLSVLDKETIIYFNKMKFNSNLFAIQYLNNIKNLNKCTQDLYKFMVNQNKKSEKFKVNFIIMKLIENFYKPYFGRNNKIKNKKNLILYSQKELEEYLNQNFENKKKIKIFFKRHNCNKPLSLSIKCILDDNIKKEIFNEKNKEISLLTLKTRKGKKINYFSILIFSDEGGNSEIDFSKKLIISYNPSYKKNLYKSNLEIINEEQIKNIKVVKINKNKILNEFHIISDIDDYILNHCNKSKTKFEDKFKLKEIQKYLYKSDDEENINYIRNKLYKEDDD